ncbi:MAG: hypothetical protein L6R36_000765 [Xanthoria steineri]|nr:MAG: hypothetical protein L6R36_000765 [Xanthoria steineri]
MAFVKSSSFSGLVLVLTVLLLSQAAPAAAFGAGNIASISKIEGRNWRHGDIEDMLKTIAFIKGHKWTSMMVKRVYFGNWLRDYSQAVDVGTLKGIQSATIRILVWVLSFLSFGYATAEFEVTEERLGVYRPEEHIDNPKDYADNADARQYDPRLRPPVQPIELQVDPNTGMKNYIANGNLGIATSAGYIKHSFARSIHYGRVYTNGAGSSRGREADLCEALRCLGQGLHCMEDFGAHTNYTELALREIGYHNVFPHCGSATEINIRGPRVFPLVTGTFGAVDFLHSVLGEATDHFAQTEIDQMDIALGDAQKQSKPSGAARSAADGSRGSDSQLSSLTGLLSQMPGAGGLCQQAEQLQAQSDAQEQAISGHRDVSTGAPPAHINTQFSAPPGAQGGPPGPGIPGMSASFDPIKTAAQIYPILEFRDKVAKAISATIEKIPGLEALVEKITERLTLFVLSLLAPFIRPIINAVSAQLKAGSTSVVDASGRHQYEPWTDPLCSDPTHSLLSKDHFSNILNEPAGQVASAILTYVAPRIFYAWQHPDIPLDQVLNDIVRVFHHPAARQHDCEIHQTMFSVIERWARSRQGPDLNSILSSESVRAGKNHIGTDAEGRGGQHNHGGLPSMPSMFPGASSSYGNKPSGSSGLPNMSSFLPGSIGTYGSKISSALGGMTGSSRDMPSQEGTSFYPGTATGYDSTRPPTGPAPSYGYENQQQQQPPYPDGNNLYGQQPQPPYPQDIQYGHHGPPPEQQQYAGYAAPQQQPSYPYGGGPPQGQTQYGADPNAPPPPPQYGTGTGYYGGQGGY